LLPLLPPPLAPAVVPVLGALELVLLCALLAPSLPLLVPLV
jgi:hypothetical protein